MVRTASSLTSAPAGYRLPREVSAVAVRWYLRYGLSCGDVEELLAARGIGVEHVTVYRWVHTVTPEFVDAARHAAGDRCFVEETYIKVAGRWTYLYRTVDLHGQVIDVLDSTPPRCRRGTRVVCQSAHPPPGADPDHDRPRAGLSTRR